MIKKYVFILVALLSLTTYAQRTCGTSAFMAEQIKDPAFLAQHTALQNKFQENLKRSDMQNREVTTTYTIPVAVHFVDGNESDRECLEALAQNQVDILNADYRGENDDLSNWTSDSQYYGDINTAAFDIQFVLATGQHPANTDDDLVEGGPAVTIGYNFAADETDSNWAGYMNFVVKDAGGGILGYSPLGGNPSIGACVVIAPSAFGSTGNGCSGYVPGAPYNLGRTLTHELGHFLNLSHTWGDGNGSCTEDDSVTDTPNTDSATYSAPSAGSVTKCDETTLTMNYMDYTDDAAMYMFTEGQETRSYAYLDTIYDMFDQSKFVAAVDGYDLDAFSVYPNPVSNNTELTITFKDLLSNNAVVTLFDITGKVVNKTEIGTGLEAKVTISAISKGIYFMKISNANFSSTQKLIIK